MPIRSTPCIMYKAGSRGQVWASRAMSTQTHSTPGMALEACLGSILLHSKASLDELFLDFRQRARKRGTIPTLALCHSESPHPGDIPLLSRLQCSHV